MSRSAGQPPPLLASLHPPPQAVATSAAPAQRRRPAKNSPGRRPDLLSFSLFFLSSPPSPPSHISRCLSSAGYHGCTNLKPSPDPGSSVGSLHPRPLCFIPSPGDVELRRREGLLDPCIAPRAVKFPCEHTSSSAAVLPCAAHPRPFPALPPRRSPAALPPVFFHAAAASNLRCRRLLSPRASSAAAAALLPVERRSLPASALTASSRCVDAQPS